MSEKYKACFFIVCLTLEGANYMMLIGGITFGGLAGWLGENVLRFAFVLEESFTFAFERKLSYDFKVCLCCYFRKAFCFYF